MKVESRLQLWAMRCRSCSQTWLIAGAQRGETYLCKQCGNRLHSDAPKTVPELPLGDYSPKQLGEESGRV